jgi:hypothetical protein
VLWSLRFAPGGLGPLRGPVASWIAGTNRSRSPSPGGRPQPTQDRSGYLFFDFFGLAGSEPTWSSALEIQGSALAGAACQAAGSVT